MLEHAGTDRGKAVVGVFRLAGQASESEFTFRPKGIDRGRTYRIMGDNSGQWHVRSGSDLVERGVLVRLPAPMSSELLVIEETAERGSP